MTALPIPFWLAQGARGAGLPIPASPISLGDPTLFLWHPYADKKSLGARKGPSAALVRSGNSGMYFNLVGLGVFAGTNLPAFVHDPVNSNNSLGLRIEAASTNLAKDSEDLQTAATNWQQGGSAFSAQSANAADGLDGTTTADSLTFVANFCSLDQNITWANVVHTLYVWVWTTSGTKDFRIKTWDGTTNYFTNNLTATTTKTRFSFTTPAALAPSGGNFAIVENTAKTAGELIVWGFKNVASSVITSYIPTAGSTVTRNAETCITDITGLITDEVTIEIEGRTAKGLDGDQVFTQLDAGDEDDRFRLFRNSSGNMHFIVTETTTEVADLDLGAVANDTDFKVIVAARAGRFVGAVEGNSAGTPDTAGNFPTGVGTLREGHDVTGSHCQSTIASVKLRNVFDEAAVDAIAA